MNTKFQTLSEVDADVFEAIQGEQRRQTDGIELIASENYVSRAVLEAQGSILTNKYAEGYPGRRYYGGCEWVDVAERLAIQRAKALFGAEHANVQPHSGSQANMAAYLALLRPGDRIMAMDLAHGGHLTHGSPVNLSGQMFEFVTYGVERETEQLDYDRIDRLAREQRPRLLVAGATAYPRSIDFARMGQIAEDVGAYFMVDIAHIAGLVATKLHPDPIPHAQIVTSTTHKTLRGPRGGLILCEEAFAAAVDRAIFPGTQGGPLMHIVAAKAVAFKEAMEPGFVSYQRQIVANARALAEELGSQGLRIVSGGTDNHLLLVDLSAVGVTGHDAETVLNEVGITVNKNLIPYDKRPPRVTSGIRLGTPALTSRGFKEDDLRQVGRLIATTLCNIGDKPLHRRVRDEVRALCARFPVPGIDA